MKIAEARLASKSQDAFTGLNGVQSKKPRISGNTSSPLDQPSAAVEDDSQPSTSCFDTALLPSNHVEYDGGHVNVDDPSPLNPDGWALDLNADHTLDQGIYFDTLSQVDLDIPLTTEHQMNEITTDSPGSDEVSQFAWSFLAESSPLFPILLRERIEREMRQPPTPSIQSLRYAMALAYVTGLRTRKDLEQIYYDQATKFINATEGDLDCWASSSSINTLQALLLIVRYELHRGYCARAFLALSRALSWAKLTRLNAIDSPDTFTKQKPSVWSIPHLSLSLSEDGAEREEARRCFWAIYIFEAYSVVLSDGAIESTQDADVSWSRLWSVNQY